MSPLISSLGSASAKALGRALRPFIRKPSIISPANNATNQSSSSLSFSTSAAQIVGKGTAHASSDWQIASTSNFTTIVASTTSDTTNKTSWTVTSGLSLNTTHYARVRYKDSTNLVSDWSDTITFTVENYLPSLANGTSNITVQDSSATSFTVPQRVGRIRVQMIGGGGYQTSGGYMDTSFDVVPGEVFTFAKTAAARADIGYMDKARSGSATAFWISNGSNTITQATLWAIVGGGGGVYQTGSVAANGGDSGGNGGGDVGGSGSNSSYGQGFRELAFGGTQSGGGVKADASIFAGNYSNSTTYIQPAGGAIEGVPGYSISGNPDRGYPGSGAGWYSGCGVVSWYTSSRYWVENDDGWHWDYYVDQGSSGSGGGSSRIQIPSHRNPTITTNQRGSSGAPNLTTGIMITY